MTNKFCKSLIICLCLLVFLPTAAIYLRAPIFIAFELAETFPLYFKTGIRQWQNQSSGFEFWLPRIASFKLYRDWLTHERNATGLPENLSRQFVLEMRSRLKDKVLTQRQVQHTSYEQVPYTTLVYGLTYCDGINFLFGDLLSEQLPQLELWYTLDITNNQSNHTLLKATRDDKQYFLDAWSDIPIFTIGISTGHNIPEYDDLPGKYKESIKKRFLLDGKRLYKFAPQRFNYGKIHLSFLDFGRQIADAEFLNRPFIAYLKARMLHVYGYEKEALTAYQKLESTGCAESSALFCKTNRILLNENRQKNMASGSTILK